MLEKNSSNSLASREPPPLLVEIAYIIVNREYFVVRLVSDSLAYAIIKHTKYI